MVEVRFNIGFVHMKVSFVLFLSVFLPVSALACAQEEESHALDLRALQSSMMVAALSCDQQGQYNKFIRKYQDNFVEGSEEIKSYFRRTYGSGYEVELNRFITRLANEATKSSMRSDADVYCEQTAAIFDELFTLREDRLDEFAQQQHVSVLHGVNSCS